jgi:hypothetical protein
MTSGTGSEHGEDTRAAAGGGDRGTSPRPHRNEDPSRPDPDHRRRGGRRDDGAHPEGLTLDRWRALVDQLGNANATRRSLADRELDRLTIAPDTWTPATPAELAIELGRVFGGWPERDRTPEAIDRSRTIARHLASPNPADHTAEAIGRAIERSPITARSWIRAYRERIDASSIDPDDDRETIDR